MAPIHDDNRNTSFSVLSNKVEDEKDTLNPARLGT